MAKLVSKTYSEALFELAVENEKTREYLEEVEGLLQVIRTTPEFDVFMKHPKITKDEKVRFVQSVLTDKADKEILGFIVTIIEKDRYGEIEKILTSFINQIKEYLSIGTAYVTSAIPLQEDEKTDVKNKLLGTTKYNTIDCHFEVDKDIIGGLIIKMGDTVVDSSIRTKLSHMERDLLSIQI